MRRRLAALTSFAAAVLVLLGAAAATASPGRPSLEAYFQSHLRDGVYQKTTFDRVAKAWKTPPASKTPKVGAKTVVQAVIARDGKLVSATVSMRSGSDAWDAAALAAVKGAAPFDPLPASHGHPSVEVHFHVSVVP